jgi:serine/threonine protein kinase
LEIGAFGIVCKGTWKGELVAVKQVNGTGTSPESRQAFLKELELMFTLGKHPNGKKKYFFKKIHSKNLKYTLVIETLGVIESPLAVVVRFYKNGALDKYLENTSKISLSQKISWIKDIASGMKFLNKHKIIHRDLAAR